jgi:hypothetical protein
MARTMSAARAATDRSALRVGALCVAVGAAGVLLGARAFGTTAAPHGTPQPPVTAAPAQPSPVTAYLDDGDRAALRALHDELSAARAPTKASPGPPLPSPADAPRETAPTSPEALRALDRVRTSVDDGLARGQWTAEDRDRVRADARLLPAETLLETMAPLIVAANGGRVHVAVRGRLF